VEIEDWNEYGELKQHVKIVPVDGSPVPPPAPVQAKPSAKPVIAGEVETSKPETPKAPAEGSSAQFTLAMRDIGQEAAQKAKEVKTKGMQVLSGSGKADETKQALGQSATVPPPVVTSEPLFGHARTVIATAPLQSPTTTSWSRASFLDEPQVSALHSGTGPGIVPPTLATERSSSISEASAEEIKEIEDSETIQEEDEEDDDDEESSEEEEEK